MAEEEAATVKGRLVSSIFDLEGSHLTLLFSKRSHAIVSKREPGTGLTFHILHSAKDGEWFGILSGQHHSATAKVRSPLSLLWSGDRYRLIRSGA